MRTETDRLSIKFLPSWRSVFKKQLTGPEENTAYLCPSEEKLTKKKKEQKDTWDKVERGLVKKIEERQKINGSEFKHKKGSIQGATLMEKQKDFVDKLQAQKEDSIEEEKILAIAQEIGTSKPFE